MRQQRGFTLLELMVAMAIFAALAVAGWQVFDSVSRARERAQTHADNLAVLQYAYLQLQQDMGQIVAYQSPSTQAVNSSQANSNTNNANELSQAIIPEPFMQLNSQQISFIRFADPDPRYQSSPSLQRIDYVIVDGRLIRQQYSSIDGGNNSISLDTVLLDEISAANWQAYLPELSDRFPGADSNSTVNQSVSQNASTIGLQTNSTKPEINLLPKGIGINFTYKEMPISWQFALTPQALAISSKNNTATNNTVNGDANTSSNSNGNSPNNNTFNTGNSSSIGSSNSNDSSNNNNGPVSNDSVGTTSANQGPLNLP